MNRLSELEIQARLDDLLKPPGSLGQLERLAARLCLIQQTTSPVTQPRRLVLFAGDHGVVAEGVTAWPSSVTGLMIGTILAGKSASAALARTTQTAITLIDVGSLDDDSPSDTKADDGQAAQVGISFLEKKVRSGTRNLAREPALTKDEFQSAIDVGKQQALSAASDGICIVAAGEMGIGNTTPSSCLAMLLADVPLDSAVGRGAGVDDEGMLRKRQVAEAAVDRARRLFKTDALAAMASVGGLEIAAMAGFFMEAHRQRLTIILDGFVASASALVAERLAPGISASMIAAHHGAEPGHGAVLEHLGLCGLLDWQLRLGEGTGALLLMPLLDAAAAMIRNMRTFSELEIGQEPV